MDMLKIKYSTRIFIMFIAYIVLFVFTLKFVIDVNLYGCFIYTITIGSRLFDIFSSLIMLIPLTVISTELYYDFIQLKVVGDDLKVKRLFTKIYTICKSNIVIEGGEQISNSEYHSGRFFIIKDSSNPNIKIKISEYYIRNYEEISAIISICIHSGTL